MNSILLIGSFDGQDALVKAASSLPDTSLTKAEDEQGARINLAASDPSLIICNLKDSGPVQLDNLAKITRRYPHIPAIVTLNPDHFQVPEVMKTGVSVCLCHPVDPGELVNQIVKVLEESTSGSVRGIPIHSLLQMLETEEKTCTLRISNRDETGHIFIRKGVVIAAELGERVNEDAVYAILTWENSEVELLHFNSQRAKTIKKPLISLIMEAFRLKDERDSLKEKQELSKKPKLDLKHISTSGSRISLDIGAKIKMEFDELETPLVSTMIGMVPDQYIIVSTPQPFSIVQNAMENENRVIVKYVHMGRLCMFKSLLLKTITDPSNLLFLNYPPVIHFHELRRAKRTSIFVPCTIHLPQGPEYYGVLVDLSGLGCLCQVKMKGNADLPAFDIDTRIQLRCLLPGLKDDQELGGIVKNIKKSATEVRIGIEFIGLQTYLKDVIEKYLYSVESISV